MYVLCFTASVGLTLRLGLERQQQSADRSGTPAADCNSLPSRRFRRTRASKLGQSLYCVGGCRRMLTLDQFPANHVGVCTVCTTSSNTALPLPVVQSRHSDNQQEDTDLEPELSDNRHSSYSERQIPIRARQRAQMHATSPLSFITSGLPNTRQRRNPYSALSGSVTTYSDVGQYPSGRSTYGVTKPSQRTRNGRTKNSAIPFRLANNDTSQVSSEAVLARRLQELRELLNSLSQTEHETLIRSLSRNDNARYREEDLLQSQHAQEVAHNEASLPTSETEAENAGDEDTTIRVTLYPVTSTVTNYTDEICRLWDVPDISHVFPKNIWPNPKTP